MTERESLEICKLGEEAVKEALSSKEIEKFIKKEAKKIVHEKIKWYLNVILPPDEVINEVVFKALRNWRKNDDA